MCKRRFVSLLLVLITCFSLFTSCVFNRLFHEFESEVDYKLSYFNAIYGFVNLDEKTNFTETISDKYKDIRLHTLICKKDERIYCLYYKLNAGYGIASININGDDFSTIFETDFIKNQTVEKRLVGYCDKTGLNGAYYDNGNIYFQYADLVLEYNIETEEKTFLEELPTQDLQWEINEEERGIRFWNSDNTKQRVITLDTMAENNYYAKQIRDYSKENSVFISGDELDKYFFNKDYSYVAQYDGITYLVNPFMQTSGDTHFFVFEYDFETNDVKYVNHYFTSGPYYGDFYIVPEVKQPK